MTNCCQPLNPLGSQHALLMANLVAQSEALEIASTKEPQLAHDSSTNTLIRRYRRLREPHA